MAADLIMRQTTNGLGGAATSTEVSSTPLNNIFDDVDDSEATSGDIEYRAIDIYNDGDATAAVTSIHMKVATTSTDTQIQMGLESSYIDSTTSIATESIAPAAVSFAYYNSSSLLSIGDVTVGSYARVWLKRIVDATAGNQRNDTGTISFRFA